MTPIKVMIMTDNDRNTKPEDTARKDKEIGESVSFSDVCYILSALIFTFMVCHAILSDGTSHSMASLVVVIVGWVLMITGCISKAFKGH